jgi:hypothetical protein
MLLEYSLSTIVNFNVVYKCLVWQLMTVFLSSLVNKRKRLSIFFLNARKRDFDEKLPSNSFF